MFSNIADSSKAGFMVALSTKASAWVETSANFRNQRIFCLMSCFERSIVSFVSISYAHRLGTPLTAVGFAVDVLVQQPAQAMHGLVEASMVRLPSSAPDAAQ